MNVHGCVFMNERAWMCVHGHLTGTWEAEWWIEKKDGAVTWTCIVTPEEICAVLHAAREPEPVL